MLERSRSRVFTLSAGYLRFHLLLLNKRSNVRNQIRLWSSPNQNESGSEIWIQKSISESKLGRMRIVLWRFVHRTIEDRTSSCGGEKHHRNPIISSFLFIAAARYSSKHKQKYL
uniref:Putative ovule protein n=1 Tax=Solanum chacoense TaxID=4108 RepID=A0A0V0GWV8_SOLCH